MALGRHQIVQTRPRATKLNGAICGLIGAGQMTTRKVPAHGGPGSRQLLGSEQLSSDAKCLTRLAPFTASSTPPLLRIRYWTSLSIGETRSVDRDGRFWGLIYAPLCCSP